MTQEAIEGANGSELTEDEARAVRSLDRLARRWPQTLKLVSMSGSLHVIHSADERFGSEVSTERGEAVLHTIHGIPNDGGDW
jgi:hypothetical protein